MTRRAFGIEVQLYMDGGPPPGGYAQPPKNAPVAWPTQAGSKVPVTGQLEPHVQAVVDRIQGKK